MTSASLTVLRTAIVLVVGLVVGLLPTAAQAQILIVGTQTTDIAVGARPSNDDDLRVVVQNHGPNESAGTVEVTLAAGLEATSVPSGCTERDVSTLICTTGALDPGSRTTFPIGLAQTIRGGRTVTVVLIDTTVQDADSSNDTATTTIDGLAQPAPGHDPIQTAVNASRLRFPDAGSAASVVLARHDNFADSLAGSVLLGDAPLLLTPSDDVDPRTDDEIDRVLGTEGGTIVVLGGVSAVADQVVADQRARGREVVRLAGPSRHDTALAIASYAFDVFGATDHVFVARARGEGSGAWADAIAVGGMAAARRRPVLLVDTDGVPASVAGWLVANAITSTTILGGTSAISVGVEQQLPGATRIAGPDRAATAAAIAAPLGAEKFLIVNGYHVDGWADGLVAAGLVADTGAPILYSGAQSVPASTEDAVTSCSEEPVRVAFIGDEIRLPEPIRQQIDALDTAACG